MLHVDTPPRQQMASLSLRDQMASRHDALEQTVDDAFARNGSAAYIALLSMLNDLHWQLPGYGAALRSLRADLAFMGQQAVTMAQPWPVSRRMRNLGLRYIITGSRLGARVLRLDARIQAFPRQYLTQAAAEPGRLDPIRQRIDRLSADDYAQLVRRAGEIFDCAHTRFLMAQ